MENADHIASPLPLPKSKVLVIGPFPPEDTKTSFETTRLTYSLLLGGVTVNTVALPGNSIAQHKISFRAKRRFDRSLDMLDSLKLTDHDLTVLFAGAAFNRVLDAPSLNQKKKEVLRLFQLCTHLFKQSQTVALVGCSAWQRRILRVFVKAGSGNLIFLKTTDVSAYVLPKLRVPLPTILDTGHAIQTVLENASHGGGPLQLTPDRLLDHMRALGVQSQPLEDIANLAKCKALRKHPVIAKLLGNVQEQPSSRILEAANTPHDNTGLTPYAEHLRYALNLEDRFPIKTFEDRSRYRNWYTRDAAHLVPSGWVPAINPPKPPATPHIAIPDWLTPILLGEPPTGSSIGKWHLLIALLAGAEVAMINPTTVLNSAKITDWFERFTKLTQSPPRTPAITLAGLTDGTTGLGGNLKMSATTFAHLGLPTELHDPRSIVEPLHKPLPSNRRLKKPIVLHHVNADRVPMQMVTPRFVSDIDALHIGFLLWEFEQIPKAHRFALDLLDEIWVPTTFVANAYKRATHKPVHIIKKGLDLPNLPAKPKNKQFTCLTCFDFHSSVERKNPLAAVQAFQMAFPKRAYQDCRMIVKTTPMVKKHWGDPNNQMGQIRKLARWDRRIVIQDEYLNFLDLLQLINTADCLLSPHRAEGFGYLPAYALKYSTPVVTSDFGGVQDFCTSNTSFPVPITLQPVPQGHSIFPMENAQWADVSPDAIAPILQALYTNSSFAHQRSRIGAQLMDSEYAIKAQAARYEDHLIRLGAVDSVA